MHFTEQTEETYAVILHNTKSRHSRIILVRFSSALFQEYLSMARDETARLSVRVQQLESALAKVKSIAQGFREERDRLRKKVHIYRLWPKFTDCSNPGELNFIQTWSDYLSNLIYRQNYMYLWH